MVFYDFNCFTFFSGYFCYEFWLDILRRSLLFTYIEINPPLKATGLFKYERHLKRCKALIQAWTNLINCTHFFFFSRARGGGGGGQFYLCSRLGMQDMSSQKQGGYSIEEQLETLIFVLHYLNKTLSFCDEAFAVSGSHLIHIPLISVLIIGSDN